MRPEIDDEYAHRLSVAHEAWKRASWGAYLARKSFQEELIHAVNNGVRKAAISRLLSVSRQAVDDYMRWGNRDRRHDGDERGRTTGTDRSSSADTDGVHLDHLDRGPA